LSRGEVDASNLGCELLIDFNRGFGGVQVCIHPQRRSPNFGVFGGVNCTAAFVIGMVMRFLLLDHTCLVLPLKQHCWIVVSSDFD
jgi:hypothetical protein